MESRVVAALALTIGTAAAAPAPSNPAFLGIGPLGRALKGCLVEGVASGGAAAEAGIRPGDVILAADGMPLAPNRPCEQLVAAITSHAAGEAVRIDVAREGQHLAVIATLTTRADVIQNHVGRRVAAIRATDVDDPRQQVDLVQSSGQPVVLGFSLPQCHSCGRIVGRVADRVRRLDPAAAIVSVVPRWRDDASTARVASGDSVRASFVDGEVFDSLAISDPDRVFFMVIDRAGGLALLAPIAPDSDDLDASIDDVVAAAVHAARRRR